MTATRAAVTPAGRDRGTYGGMLAVAVAAAVLSFSALSGLAELAGVTAGLPLPEARSCVTVRSGFLRVPAQIGQRRTR